MFETLLGLALWGFICVIVYFLGESNGKNKANETATEIRELRRLIEKNNETDVTKKAKK